MKKLLSIGLTLALTLGLATPALAYSTPDFSDVPQSHWAYAAIMEMADAEIIQGTGGGRFSPEEPLSAEMFITLVGRVMFPEIETQGGDWSGPYVAAMKDRGFLKNTNITGEVLNDDISRYDMAVILAWCLKSLSGIVELGSPPGITDLEEMPYHYMGAVQFVCAAGLIRGDENHRFNGANSMTRQEAAVVIGRLSFLKRSLDGSSPSALTVKEHALSVADMDYYYHNALNTAYEQELMLESLYVTYGLGTYTPSFDPLSSLRTQYVDEAKTQSYHDYFLEQAKTTAIQALALSDTAKAQGYTMSQESQDALKTAYADLDEQVKMYRFHSRESYLKSVYGLRMTEEVYSKNLELELLAKDYFDAQINAMGGYSEEVLTAYYNEHVGELNSYDYNYAYYDGMVQGEADPLAMSQAKEQAQKLVAAVKASDGSSAAFVKAKGYTAVRTAELGSRFAASPYASWLMDPNRRDGDVELFELEGQGYYVVQFHKVYRDDHASTVAFRHILFSTDPGDNSEPTATETAQTEAQARATLKQFRSGPQTAEAFGSLADRDSQDGRDEEGSLYYPGGLYDQVERGEMVQSIDDWCFDPRRQAGDTALVQSEYGWHVMYFQGYYGRPAWMGQAEEEMKAMDQEAFLTTVQSGYEAVEGPGWSWVGLGVDEIDG